MKQSISCALLVLYFGEFPSYFKIWLDSCAHNVNYNWIIFTDQSIVNYAIPKNIKVINYTFDEIKSRIESCFDFPINLDKPYKLCDYRPAFGYIFKDELVGYDYWGYCDIDQIFGDLDSFVGEDLKGNYDKLYQNGHLSIFKNEDKINNAFMLNNGLDYKKVFSTRISCVFDESDGIQKIFDSNGFNTCKRYCFADIDKRHYDFRLCKYLPYLRNINRFLFYYDNGHIYCDYFDVNGNILKKEFSYIHFSGRNIDISKLDNSSSYYITNKGLIPKTGSTNIDTFKKLNLTNFFLEISSHTNFYKFIWKRKINKYIFKE